MRSLPLQRVGVTVLLVSLALTAAPAVWGATEKVHITLPAGWKEGDAVEPAVQFGENLEKSEFFQLIVEAKGDFSAKVDLMAYAQLAQQRSAEKSKLAHRTETPLKANKVNGHETAEYEVQGDFRDTRLHYRHIAFSCGTASWCQIVAWTLPSHWDAAQTDFETLFKNVR
jgi:hypothetical protein